MIFALFARRNTVAAVIVALFFRASGVFAAENLSPLAPSPDWPSLEQYQETITHDEFTALLREVYCARGLSPEILRIDSDTAQMLINKDAQSWFTLRFAKDLAARKPITRMWRRAKSLPQPKRSKTLSGLHVALDPGHIGGRWAQMEERWFKLGDATPVQEGDMTLRVAKILATRLRILGAKVSFVRRETEPVTPQRPDDLRLLARDVLIKSGASNPPESFDGPVDPAKEQAVRWQSELLFYRNSEIRARAAIVNSKLRPDVVLCLHFNAHEWGDPKNPTLIDANDLHLLANGAYMESELAFDDVRFEMMRKLLSRTSDEEIPLVESVAGAMLRELKLPPYVYTTDNVIKLGTTGYVYARDLMANRIYNCPVVYCEPYDMNGKEAFARIQAGDYEGTREILGVKRPSIYREYAKSVADGLVEYYSAKRRN